MVLELSESLKLRKMDYAVLVILLGIAVFTVSTMTRHVIEEQAAIDVAPETRDINPLSVAVLPLENLNPQTTEQYFVAGMHDSLISSLAYAALGQGYMELVYSLLPKSEASTRAMVAAEKALELDPSLAEAHLAKGLDQWYGEWDFEAAEASIDRALELNPSLADAWYHRAWFLEQLGNDDEAVYWMKQARD